MTDHAETFQEPVISAALVVTDGERLSFLPESVGFDYMLRFENAVYDFMQQNGDGSYSGGFWEYFKLSNGGFYMAPAGDEKYTVETGNGSFKELSGQATGIIACLFILGALANKYEEDKHIEAYHALRDFVGNTKEYAAIYQAID